MSGETWVLEAPGHRRREEPGSVLDFSGWVCWWAIQMERPGCGQDTHLSPGELRGQLKFGVGPLPSVSLLEGTLGKSPTPAPASSKVTLGRGFAAGWPPPFLCRRVSVWYVLVPPGQETRRTNRARFIRRLPWHISLQTLKTSVLEGPLLGGVLL